MDRLRVEVLGPVRAWRGPVELALGPARQRAVFAVLALRAGRPVTRDELVSAVWGAAAPKSVAGNIHTYISGLRRALQADRALLTSDPAGYRLDVPAVDAIEFERLLRNPDALDAALALWHGDPLSGMPGPFAERERSRLAELRLDALERRASALLDAGADDEPRAELRAELTALVREYPLRERFRELLMLALHRGGQRAEALEVYAEGRRVLAAELGVAPGAALRELHARLLGDEPDAPDRLLVRPPPPGEPFVGRHAELRRLRTLVDVLREGRGGAIWVEGDFGIGKSALLAHALASVPERGCQLGWAVADERSADVPLGVVLDCLRTGAESADAVLALVAERCRHAPLVLVADGMQWADEASAQVWHRLTAAARQLPLLLVAAARPMPRGPALTRLRHELHSRDAVLVLDPLSADESLELRDRLTGSPGPRARELVLGMAGNPRYITELATSANPASLLDTARGQLDVLSDEARETLRAAALLGVEFTVTGVAAVAGKRPSELLAVLEEATAANIVADAGDHLAFRHPLLREACYAEIRSRGPRHRAAAEALASAGAPVAQVADQLAAAGLDDWGLAWLVDHHTALANRAPLVAAELLDRAVSLCLADDPRREVLAAARVRVLYRLDRHPEREAAEALAMATDPHRAAEMRQLLATLRFRRGDVEAAIRTVTVDEVPEIWRQRYRHLLAGFRRGRLDDDLDAAEAAGREALAEAAGDAYLTAHARQTLWLVATVRRDHEGALGHVDAALDSVQAGSDLELDLLDNKLFTCHNLDRLDEAEATVHAARGRPFQLSAALHHYWVGRWNEALVELDAVEGLGFGLRDPAAMALLRHGLAALIAGRRGDGIQAAAHLDAVARHGSTVEEREKLDFLLMAEMLLAEQCDDLDLSIVDPLLEPGFAPMMLRHQWLPEVVRLALAAGDGERVSRAVRVCAEEAAKERVTARATVASWWCRGLVEDDPAPVLAAAEHYRRVGRVVELGSALEDAAVLLARAGTLDAARKAFDECVGVYADLSARWDLDRADARLSEFGITVTRFFS
ncbi:BTAD domain-containing putative transcriptional regulator [Actinophytocola sp.]|uniref:BTAD domain-containing putative transcriptional regulator n=1 Tax=Actinophytocola sp. TaxID=1872138 RepID=UPI00389AB997